MIWARRMTGRGAPVCARDHSMARVTRRNASTALPCSWATECREKWNRGAVGDPPWGPVEVTTVPRATTTVNIATINRASRTCH